MAKQLQVRRGVEQAQNLFTGAEGEITMTTDTKELRIHDGTKTGGFRVPTLVAVQYPSAANNYTWYRKYSDGWVEQGGLSSVSNSGVQTALPVTMADTNYFISITKTSGDTGRSRADFYVTNKTVNSFTGVQYDTSNIVWEVKGMAA